MCFYLWRWLNRFWTYGMFSGHKTTFSCLINLVISLPRCYCTLGKRFSFFNFFWLLGLFLIFFFPRFFLIFISRNRLCIVCVVFSLLFFYTRMWKTKNWFLLFIKRSIINIWLPLLFLESGWSDIRLKPFSYYLLSTWL